MAKRITKSASSQKKPVKSKQKATPSGRSVKSKHLINQEVMIAALEAAKVKIWEWDVNTNEVVWSDKTYLLFGIAT